MIEYLSQLLFAENIISDKALFIRDVLAREELGPTGFDNQVAIPHGKSPPCAKREWRWPNYGTLLTGKQKMRLPSGWLFCLPSGNADSGIGTYQSISQCISRTGDDEIVEQLMQAESREALYRLIVKQYRIINLIYLEFFS
ncbi:PTS sugar transporter subunit IIA (plasmid) [Pseudomonas silvicola]|nr:PTS sugar transporter subunit IIA [Pseudomonas silvicola]